MTGLMQGYVWLGLGVALGLCGGFPWGRWVGRRVKAGAHRAGVEWGLDHCGAYQPDGDGECNMSRDHAGDHGVIDWSANRRLVTWPWEVMPVGPGWNAQGLTRPLESVPRPVAGGLVSDGRGQPAIAPGHPWQDQIAAELAPEALAAIPPAQDAAWREMVALGQEIELDVPGPGHAAQGEPASGNSRTPVETAGLGHSSPYPGALTPAQRRRDKHKQRGQYAPAQGWSAPDADMLRETWKPEGAHWLADWQIEWHDDVAQIDEEIAGWVERQRGWLAADRWDRGARRLGAVA